MARFFDRFPITRYSFSTNKYPDYQLITNILFRTAILKDIINNSSAYMKYVIRDGDTPEILASKVYKDAEAHWVILYANEIIDPQYDWPLTYNTFNKYIADKYRAMAEADVGNTLTENQIIAWTQDLTNPANVHHYEKVVKQENQSEQVTTERRYIINKTKLTNNELSVPHDYYDELAEEQDVTPINLTVNGQTVIQTIYRNFVTYYDYENELNESKRNIRIIKIEYYQQIVGEFERLTGTSLPSFIRRVS
jgi:hypothetical protein